MICPCACCGYPIPMPDTDEDGEPIVPQICRSCWLDDAVPAPSVASPSRTMERE